MVNKKTKDALCMLSEYNCELCKKKFDQSELVCHRLRRKNSGGTYHWRNVQILCSSCHRLIHGREFT